MAKEHGDHTRHLAIHQSLGKIVENKPDGKDGVEGKKPHLAAHQSLGRKKVEDKKTEEHGGVRGKQSGNQVVAHGGAARQQHPQTEAQKQAQVQAQKQQRSQQSKQQVQKQVESKK